MPRGTVHDPTSSAVQRTPPHQQYKGLGLMNHNLARMEHTWSRPIVDLIFAQKLIRVSGHDPIFAQKFIGLVHSPRGSGSPHASHESLAHLTHQIYAFKQLSE
jgi:hypothetical protein